MANGVTYCYYVRALSASGQESGNSNTACATLPGTITGPTPTPTLTPTPRPGTTLVRPVIYSVVAGDRQITVGWTVVPGATLYWIYRKPPTGPSNYNFYTYIGSTSGNDYRDTGLTNGTAYTYVVEAAAFSGNTQIARSGQSDPRSATPQGVAPPPTPRPTIAPTPRPTPTPDPAQGLSVSGRVTNLAGAGVPGVTVVANQVTRAKTDANGYYTLPRLGVGTHIIAPYASAPAFDPASRGVQLTTASVPGINFRLTTMPPSTLSLSRDTNVICAGGRAGGMNTAAHQARLTATLLDGLGRPQPNKSLHFYRTDSDAAYPSHLTSATAPTASDGSTTAPTNSAGQAVVTLTSSTLIGAKATITATYGALHQNIVVHMGAPQGDVQVVTPNLVADGISTTDLLLPLRFANKPVFDNTPVRGHLIRWRISHVYVEDANGVKHEAPRDAQGNYTGYGSLSPDTSYTNADGIAKTTYTVGTKVGVIEFEGSDETVWMNDTATAPTATTRSTGEAAAPIAAGKTRPKHRSRPNARSGFPPPQVTLLYPTGDPTSSPAPASSEFTYGAERIGVLTIGCQARLSPNSESVRRSFKIRFRLETLPGMTVGQGVYDAATATFKGTITCRGLPPRNSDFGLKTVRAEVVDTTGKVVAQASTRIEVFFPKYAYNHPGGQQPSENWYYYWSQIQVKDAQGKTVDSVNPFTNTWAPREPNSRDTGITKFMGGDGTGSWISYIYPFASETSTGGAWNRARGIDLFANTVRHEHRHRLDLNLWWGRHDRNRNRDKDQDENRQVIGDFIPDEIEPRLNPADPIARPPRPARPYDPTKRGTYPDAFRYLPPDARINLPDVEDYCLRRQQKWQNGLANAQDWAKPGMQHLTKGFPND